MLNRSASLAMSTCVLKALPGKLDIKRHSPSILYLNVSILAFHDNLHKYAPPPPQKKKKKKKKKLCVPPQSVMCAPPPQSVIASYGPAWVNYLDLEKVADSLVLRDLIRYYKGFHSNTALYAYQISDLIHYADNMHFNIIMQHNTSTKGVIKSVTATMGCVMHVSQLWQWDQEIRRGNNLNDYPFILKT